MNSLANQMNRAGASATCGSAGTLDTRGQVADARVTGIATDIATRGRTSCDPRPPDIRRLLRRATQRYHDRLDASSVLAPLILPNVTLAQYQAAMVAMLRTYIRVDACLLPPPATDCTRSPNALAPYRARSVAIQRDLHAMGIEPGPTMRQAAIAQDLHVPADLPTYLGMRYVIEGSQFGNRVIGRNLQAAFGNAARDMCTTWLPDATADDGWTSVMAALSALESRRDVAAALRGARRVFRYFVTHLCIPDALAVSIG